MSASYKPPPGAPPMDTFDREASSCSTLFDMVRECDGRWANVVDLLTAGVKPRVGFDLLNAATLLWICERTRTLVFAVPYKLRALACQSFIRQAEDWIYGYTKDQGWRLIVYVGEPVLVDEGEWMMTPVDKGQYKYPRWAKPHEVKQQEDMRLMQEARFASEVAKAKARAEKSQ